jgi:hypothetical protein
MAKKRKPANAPKHFRYRRTRRQIELDELNKTRYSIQKKETPEAMEGDKFEMEYEPMKFLKYPTAKRIANALWMVASSENGLLVHPYLLETFCDNRTACVMSFLLMLEYNLTTEENREFVTKYDTIMKMVGVKKNVVQRVLTALKESGVITTQLKGIPGRLHYKIDEDVLMDLLYATLEPRGYKNLDKKAFPKI